MKRIYAVIIITFFPFISNANVSVSEYLQARSVPFITSYVSGLAIGALNLNYMLKKENKLICIPLNIKYSQQLWQTILDSEIKLAQEKKINLSAFTIEPILIVGIQKKFPCK